MQNQVNMNQVSVNVEGGGAGGGAGGGGAAQPQFIIQGIPALQGGVVNLAELLNKASTGTRTLTPSSQPPRDNINSDYQLPPVPHI